MNGELLLSQVIKRNGEVVAFNPEKIENAIFKATQQSENLTGQKQKALHQLCRTGWLYY